jgi:hypothetical protein
VTTHAIDVNTSRTPEEGAQSPSWPNRLLINIIIIIIIISIELYRIVLYRSRRSVVGVVI